MEDFIRRFAICMGNDWRGVYTVEEAVKIVESHSVIPNGDDVVFRGGRLLRKEMVTQGVDSWKDVFQDFYVWEIPGMAGMVLIADEKNRPTNIEKNSYEIFHCVTVMQLENYLKAIYGRKE